MMIDTCSQLEVMTHGKMVTCVTYNKGHLEFFLKSDKAFCKTGLIARLRSWIGIAILRPRN